MEVATIAPPPTLPLSLCPPAPSLLPSSPLPPSPPPPPSPVSPPSPSPSYTPPTTIPPLTPSTVFLARETPLMPCRFSHNNLYRLFRKISLCKQELCCIAVIWKTLPLDNSFYGVFLSNSLLLLFIGEYVGPADC